MADSDTYHEPYDALSEETRDKHRAIASLVEEMEAVQWYQERIDVCADHGLRDILAHNRDEELEHAAMLIEWLRRRMPAFDEQARAHLFTEGPITHSAQPAARDGGLPYESDASLNIGSLKGGER